MSSAARACSDVGLPRAAVLGVLGGGQLGKMLAMEAVCAPFGFLQRAAFPSVA